MKIEPDMSGQSLISLLATFPYGHTTRRDLYGQLSNSTDPGERFFSVNFGYINSAIIK